ncbi:hypothetical protein QUF55_05515 [Clostridiaceae bacterium HSG29]|nr:hypothetical protein [Clostridiaceae bacterium HSG29]
MASRIYQQRSQNLSFQSCETNIRKKCIHCYKYFEVQKYLNENFIDIQDENQIHYFSENSGFQNKCKKCLEIDKSIEKNESLTHIGETERKF